MTPGLSETRPEDNHAFSVFRPKSSTIAVALLVTALVFGFGLYKFRTNETGRIMAVAMGSCFFLYHLLEFHRRIVISQKKFEYRWRSGKVESIDFAEMQRIDEVPAVRAVPGAIQAIPSLRVLLKSGEERYFPLDFPDREEILKLIRAAISTSE